MTLEMTLHSLLSVYITNAAVLLMVDIVEVRLKLTSPDTPSIESST